VQNEGKGKTGNGSIIQKKNSKVDSSV